MLHCHSCTYFKKEEKETQETQESCQAKDKVLEALSLSTMA